ncbi:hypothetical protein EV363DRAFT_1168674 [Boletus edulis]|nr:hypothetical protein EV363DRAFT_1168674 [Boletus edulis]
MVAICSVLWRVDTLSLFLQNPAAVTIGYFATRSQDLVVWVVYDALRPFFVSGIDRELILSLPLERYADRLG